MVGGFGYDCVYGCGSVKSVDSMDNVNRANSAVIRRRGGTAGMKSALLALLTLSMLLTLSALRTLLTLSRPLPQRTLLTLSTLSTRLT